MSEEKETIINSIDVSECEHHYTNLVNGTIYHGCAIYEQINELGYSQDTLCEQNPNCYFKQAKHLQEENEGLKSLNDFNVQKIEVLQKENEWLKKENEQLKKPCLVMPKVNQLAVPIEKYEKLYKALEEIRSEIGDLKNINRLINLQKILDTINEALNDRN